MDSIFSLDEIPAQSRARWFVSRGGIVDSKRGFKNKQEVNEWVQKFGYRLDWRVGYTFRLRGDIADMSIVDASGKLARV